MVFVRVADRQISSGYDFPPQSRIKRFPQPAKTSDFPQKFNRTIYENGFGVAPRSFLIVCPSPSGSTAAPSSQGGAFPCSAKRLSDGQNVVPEVVPSGENSDANITMIIRSFMPENEKPSVEAGFAALSVCAAVPKQPQERLSEPADGAFNDES